MCPFMSPKSEKDYPLGPMSDPAGTKESMINHRAKSPLAVAGGSEASHEPYTEMSLEVFTRQDFSRPHDQHLR